MIDTVDVVGNTATVTFDDPMAPGEWTCVSFTDDATQQVCQGSLPSDVDGSGKATANDILALIDSLNAGPPLPDHSADVDRSGVANVVDILETINLLNGAGDFPSYLNMEITPLACPSAP